MVAVVGFVISSVLCGIAQSLVQIVAFRLLQGFFGAARACDLACLACLDRKVSSRCFLRPERSAHFLTY
jgi:MFS family permease